MPTETSHSVRLATLGDAGALAALGAATFTETFGHLYAEQDLAAFLANRRSEEAYAAFLSDADMLVMIAEADPGELVAYVVAGRCKLPAPDVEPAAGEVWELYVLGSHQGHRLGTRLLEAALEWLDAGGRAPLYVGVWSGNDGAQRLYGRYGFEKVGEYDFTVGKHVDREFILKQVG